MPYHPHPQHHHVYTIHLIKLTTKFLSYYNFTFKYHLCRKWRKAMIYYYYHKGGVKPHSFHLPACSLYIFVYLATLSFGRPKPKGSSSNTHLFNFSVSPCIITHHSIVRDNKVHKIRHPYENLFIINELTCNSYANLSYHKYIAYILRMIKQSECAL